MCAVLCGLQVAAERCLSKPDACRAVVKGREKKVKTKTVLNTLFKKGACQWSCE